MAEVQAVHGKMHAVYIGRRFVGEISEEDWTFILAEVNTNSRLWEAQAWNLVRVVSRTVGFAFISVPLGVFWTAVTLGWLGKPIALGTHVGALLAEPRLVVAGIALAVGSMLALGLKLGYVNFFAKARSALVKERLGIEEPGDCRVH